MRASVRCHIPRACAAALWLLLGSGCATIAGTKQVISIDSEPRGVDVRDAHSGRPLGKTPVFAELPRRYRQKLELRREGADPIERTRSCRYDWQGTVLGNTPLLLIVPPLSIAWYAAGMGTDLVTGAAFECPTHVVFEGPSTNERAPPAPACASYLVVPPRHPDEKVSDFLVARWVERVKDELRECDGVVDHAEAKLALSRYGIGHRATFELEKTRREHLYEVGHRTKATHLVLLTHERDRELLAMRATVLDIHRLLPVSQEAFVVDVADEPLFHQPTLMNYLVESISILPNGLGFSPGLRGFYAAPAPGIGKLELRDPTDRLSSLATSWTLTSVENPARYGRWKVRAELSPAVSLAYVSRRAWLEPFAGEPFELETRFFHTVLVFGPQVFFHTPIGAFSSSFRMGPGVGWMRAGEETDVTLRIFSQFDFAYTAFPTDNIFVRFAFAVTETGSQHLQTEHFGVAGWNEASVTVGFHLPQIYSLVRNLL